MSPPPLNEADYSPYFAEKATQVNPSLLDAFGIKIESRYGKAGELIELLSFARALCLEGLHGLVEAAFYDSNNSYCVFTLSEDFPHHPNTDVTKAIYQCAWRTISQFEWFDEMVHGEPLNLAEAREMEARG
ncbi:MAG: hypothetical protein R3F13_17885 [Prosthecobacter sp.]